MRDLEKCVGSLEEKSGAVVDDYGGRLNPAVKERWLSAYKDSFTSIEDIPGCINLSEIEKNLIRQVTATYQMRIPHYYFSLVQHSANPKDPIWRQCVPSVEEIREDIDGKIDPLGEEKFTPTPYLVHRYPDRVLLLVTGQCFMHCRHCTRKRLWKDKNSEPILKDIEEALDYVKKNRHIREVIVSGGDPLTLSTEKLDRILLAISLIESVEVIRIGTRAPVVFPQRINDRLCAVLSKYDNLWVNVQFNHPWEITAQAVTACQKIQQCGIPISNQSVLLKGINDDQQTMTELCRKLQSVRIRPYYLFECDPVVGASHFRTPVSKGIELIKKMRGYTSGMCIPNFVVDGTDGKGKVPLAPNYLVSESEKGMLLRNYKDELFLYPDPGLRVKVSDRQETSLGVCNIGIIFNLKKNDCSGDEEEEYDEIATIESIKTEIEKLGFKSMLFEHIDSLADDLRRQKPDFVLNIAEGRGAGRSRESEVPCLLESLGIPYSGSDPISLGITLDKYFTGTMLKASAIPVPETFMIEDMSKIACLENIFTQNKLFIVKPRWEGSSKGIFLNSVVNNFSDLYERVENIRRKYCQPVLVEEFIEGEEITAAVYGNFSLRLLGMMRIAPKVESEKPFLYSLEIKRQWQDKISYQPQAVIALNIQKLIRKYALAAYRVLELKDFARIDFRVDSSNIPRIIDVNPLPGLSPDYSDLPILCRLAGKSYSELIEIILKESFKRYNLKWQ